MLIIGIIALCGFLGAYMGEPKGRKGQGIALGIILGFIGIGILACLKPLPGSPKALQSGQFR